MIDEKKLFRVVKDLKTHQEFDKEGKEDDEAKGPGKGGTNALKSPGAKKSYKIMERT